MPNKSKLTRVRPVRLPVDLDAKMVEAVEAAAARWTAAESRRRPDAPPAPSPTLNAWIVAACREKLAHQLRSQRSADRRRKTPRA